jgi:hypothetical protein
MGKPQMATLRAFIPALSSAKVSRANSSGARHFGLPRILPWTNLLMLTTLGLLLEAALSAFIPERLPSYRKSGKVQNETKNSLINYTKTGFIAHN